MKISILCGLFAVCRLTPDEATHSPPAWINQTAFWTLTRTSEEFSVVCLDKGIPNDVKKETGWSILKVEGPLDFGMTGVLSAIAGPLATAKISIFAISTFDTDYILVKAENLARAKTVLKDAGHELLS